MIMPPGAVTVMTTDGQSAFYSGEKTLGVNNALSGENCVAAGNLLANPDVIAAMVQAFEQRSGHLADSSLPRCRQA